MSQYKQYYTVYKDKDWVMWPQIHQGGMNSWHILKRFPKEEEILRYSNGWNPLTSKPQIKNIKPLPQEGKKNKKKNWRNPYFPRYRIPKMQKYSWENFFNMARALMEFKDKEEQRMRQSHFPKK
ncbi:hypothetical protein O181_080350 [Austropuccinia psidii MF-1]|uniref:Uncharacterized protein n=1 Tax=Austropuccinia psidii MF-1 TaxID=1389203 RepID=A0A9Q3FN15_9BASI|nr:hypothetical protein [Austropuccinia psidii MF-1]